MKPLSWQSVVLLLGVFVISIGTAIWLIHEKFAPPAVLLAPIGGFLLAAFGALGGYLKGLVQMPPGLEGAEVKIIQTLPPPPTAAELLGEIPPVSGDVVPSMPPLPTEKGRKK